jgi:hypothetical protein
MLTAEKLAKILDEEFEQDNWGDIDPYLFKEVVKPVKDSDHADDAEALREVLERVVKRLNDGE